MKDLHHLRLLRRLSSCRQQHLHRRHLLHLNIESYMIEIYLLHYLVLQFLLLLMIRFLHRYRRLNLL